MKELKNLPLKFQNINPYPNKLAHHLFVIILDKSKTNKRDDLVLFLKKQNWDRINYRTVTDMTVYKKNLGWNKDTAPIAKYVGDNILSLPLYPNLTFSETKYNTKKNSKFFKI